MTEAELNKSYNDRDRIRLEVRDDVQSMRGFLRIVGVSGLVALLTAGVALVNFGSKLNSQYEHQREMLLELKTQKAALAAQSAAVASSHDSRLRALEIGASAVLPQISNLDRTMQAIAEELRAQRVMLQQVLRPQSRQQETP